MVFMKTLIHAAPSTILSITSMYVSGVGVLGRLFLLGVLAVHMFRNLSVACLLHRLNF